MARERYLLDDQEESIHSNVIELKTKKEKINHWWYYYKKTLFISILLGLLVFAYIFSIVTKEVPDYTIGYLGSSFYDQTALDMIGDHLEQYGEDLNGDGQVIIHMNNCSLGTSDPNDYSNIEQQQAGYVRFASDMSSADSMIWIHDDYGYAVSGHDFDPLFVTMFEEEENPAYINLADISALDDLTFEGYEHQFLTSIHLIDAIDNFSLSFRTFEGTAKNHPERYDANLEFLNNILNETPTNNVG